MVTAHSIFLPIQEIRKNENSFDKDKYLKSGLG
jgi:hypothetical protein